MCTWINAEVLNLNFLKIFVISLEFKRRTPSLERRTSLLGRLSATSVYGVSLFTSVTPNKMVFGKNIRLPLQEVVGVLEEDTSEV
ncbi:hypothetical protein DPMN_070720 [Dreissena polymorpha]|uniref:Uncharacterized protein n=1 Tax=Dreissena polymorpha TaxID=45954 RepID=A0A9D3Z197_DREPO|nr:hypothetical protein DPMN_070720 [Dreissena polymorpha]